jgi:hypothetical protein
MGAMQHWGRQQLTTKQAAFAHGKSIRNVIVMDALNDLDQVTLWENNLACHGQNM